jgi:hypothetical protein
MGSVAKLKNPKWNDLPFSNIFMTFAIQQDHGFATAISPCENKRITGRYTEKQNKRLHVIFKTAAF